MNNGSDSEIDFDQQNPPVTGKGNRVPIRSKRISQYDEQQAKNLAISTKRKEARARNRQAKEAASATPTQQAQTSSRIQPAIEQTAPRTETEVLISTLPGPTSVAEPLPAGQSTINASSMNVPQMRGFHYPGDGVFNFDSVTNGFHGPGLDFTALNTGGHGLSLASAAWDIAGEALGQSHDLQEDLGAHYSVTQDMTALDAPPLRTPTISNDLITSASRGVTPSRQLLPQALNHRPQGVSMPSQQQGLPTAERSFRAANATQLTPALPGCTSLSGSFPSQVQVLAGLDVNGLPAGDGNRTPVSQEAVTAARFDVDYLGPVQANAVSSATAASVENTSTSGNVSGTKRRTQQSQEPTTRIKRIAEIKDRGESLVIEASYDYMRARIVGEYAFPSGQQELTFAVDSYADARNALIERGMDMSHVPEKIPYGHTALLIQRGSQVRGETRQATAFVVPYFFPFKPCSEKNQIAREENRTLYTTLITNKAFLYTNFNDITIPDTVFRCEAIQAIINRSWFRNQHSLGVTHREFFAEDGVLHNEVIALAATALRHGIDEWKEGMRRSGRKDKGIEFSQKAYHDQVYKKILKMLRKWEKHTRHVSQDDSSVSYRRTLFENALIHAGANHGETSDDDSDYEDVFARNCGQSFRDGAASGASSSLGI